MVQLMTLAGPDSGKRPLPWRGLVLAATTLGFGVIHLVVSVVIVAVKPIPCTALGGGVSGLQRVVDAYTLTFAALILAAGALGDRRSGGRGGRPADGRGTPVHTPGPGAVRGGKGG